MMEKEIFEKEYYLIKKTLEKSLETEYYNNLFMKNGIKVEEINSYEDFKKIPITGKKDYYEHSQGFLNNSVLVEQVKEIIDSTCSTYIEKDRILNKNHLELLITSGSTGVPLEVIRHKSDNLKNYLSLNRFRSRIYKLEYLENHVWVLPESIASRKFIFNEEDAYFRYSQYGHIACVDSLTFEKLKEFLHFCLENNITALICWPTFIDKLCDFLKVYPELKECLKTIKYLETNSEPLSKELRLKVRMNLNLEILDIYSGNESNFIAASCNKNQLHLLSENVFLEFIENQYGVKESIVTNLNSNFSSLIRYNLGDIGEWNQLNCGCSSYSDYPFAFSLKNCRANDLLTAKNNIYFSYNIINDLIFLAQREYNFYLGKYKVIQTKVDEFIIKHTEAVDNDILMKSKILIEEKMQEVLGYSLKIKVKLISDKWEGFKYERKFKCFENRINE